MRLDEIPLLLRAALRVYPWRQVTPVPFATLTRPLASASVALVTSAGLVAPGDAPFDARVRGGDYSWRVISGAADVAGLEEHHRSESFDHSGVERDRNVAFPLEPLRELATAAEIGSAAPRHLSFMGSITAPGRLQRTSAPAAAELFVADHVDVALLVPVWPFCHQTVGLVQNELERRGIVTASVTMLPEITARVGVPRALSVPYPLGFPMGPPGDRATQLRILGRLLRLCVSADAPRVEAL